MSIEGKIKESLIIKHKKGELFCNFVVENFFIIKF